MVPSQWTFVDSRTSPEGKMGLDVLMLIIEKGLTPTGDESQTILAGPLISDLIQKVPSPNKS
jgi:hypothetical protein